MSKIASYNTKIKIPKIHIPILRLPVLTSQETTISSHQANIEGVPSLEILENALKLVITERGGNVQDSYLDHEGHKRSALLAIRTEDFPRGIGIEVREDGSVIFLYDAEGVDESVVEAICREITQNYVVIAVMRAQKARGFDVEVKVDRSPQGAKRIKVTGLKGAENRVMVDEHGRITADYYGYKGKSCKTEEDGLRETLHDLGLVTEIQESKDKTDIERNEECQALHDLQHPMTEIETERGIKH